MQGETEMKTKVRKNGGNQYHVQRRRAAVTHPGTACRDNTSRDRKQGLRLKPQKKNEHHAHEGAGNASGDNKQGLGFSF